jgi:hypothetical protein
MSTNVAVVEQEKKYGFLRLIITTHNAVALVVLVAGVLTGLSVKIASHTATENATGFLFAVSGFLAALFVAGVGQVFQVLIDIEQNTRR